MTSKVNQTAVALKIQSAVDVWSSPTTADLIPISNFTIQRSDITVANDEYTGTIHEQGDVLAGSTCTVSFDVALRPPGGSAPPALDAFILGRIFRMFKFDEILFATAVPAAPEALGAGSTTTKAVLGATALGTANFYTALALVLAAKGGNIFPRNLTMIRSYANPADGVKGATLCETFGSAPTGNYQIPRQITYRRAVDAIAAPVASMKVWLGETGYELLNVAGTSISDQSTVSNKSGATFPTMSVSFTCDVRNTHNEAAPTIPQLASPPVWKDGQFVINGQTLAVESFSIDFAARSGAPSNPNKTSGQDAEELVGLKPTASFSQVKFQTSVIDLSAIAQTVPPTVISAFAQWGFASGGVVMKAITDMRIGVPSPNAAGDFYNDTFPGYIDVGTNISYSFVY